jgi:hypothetical protein
MAEEKLMDRYVLFGERGTPGTYSNFLISLEYLTRFKTAFGFSVDDARRASKVTIIGGTEFVTEQEEQSIADSGATVARISGSEEDIAQRLRARLESGEPLP